MLKNKFYAFTLLLAIVVPFSDAFAKSEECEKAIIARADALQVRQLLADGRRNNSRQNWEDKCGDIAATTARFDGYSSKLKDIAADKYCSNDDKRQRCDSLRKLANKLKVIKDQSTAACYRINSDRVDPSNQTDPRSAIVLTAVGEAITAADEADNAAVTLFSDGHCGKVEGVAPTALLLLPHSDDDQGTSDRNSSNKNDFVPSAPDSKPAAPSNKAS